jgi:hypothetical protein
MLEALLGKALTSLIGSVVSGLVEAWNDYRARQALRKNGELEALRHYDKMREKVRERMRSADTVGLSGALKRLRDGSA